jgi:hypothetical protein
MVSFDLLDGYYTLGLREASTDFFTVNYRSTLYRLAGLPMGLEMQQLLFLPAYRSFYPSLTRTTAQPHRTPPRYIYEPAAQATETVPTLPAKLAMEGSPITPVHGRLPIFCRQQRRSSTIATISRTLLQGFARDARWLPARLLEVLAGKVQFLYLAILASRFYLRVPHDVLATCT